MVIPDVNRPAIIGVLGTHSTGKSTFLARLAHELRLLGRSRVVPRVLTPRVSSRCRARHGVRIETPSARIGELWPRRVDTLPLTKRHARLARTVLD